MTDNVQEKVFDINNLPADAEVSTGQGGTYATIDDSQIYQVEVSKIDFRQNPFYIAPPENATQEQIFQAGNKYQFNFTFTILDEGEFRGRKLWSTTSLALKPTTKGGKGEPTILFKIVTKVMNTLFNWDDCASFAPDTKTLFENLNSNVLGKQLKVSIENTLNPDTKKTKTKIKTYYSAKETLETYVAPARDSQGNIIEDIVIPNEPTTTDEELPVSTEQEAPMPWEECEKKGKKK